MLIHHVSENALHRFPPPRKTVSPQVKNYDNVSRVFEIANQLLTCREWMAASSVFETLVKSAFSC